MAHAGGFEGAGIGGSKDHKQIVLSIMKEIGKSNKFIHKNDIYSHV